MKYGYLITLCVAPMIVLAGCSGNQEADTKSQEEPLVGPSAELAALSGFNGLYVIIDARRASDVAFSGMPGVDADSPIGQIINFTQTGIEMEGAACDQWTIQPVDNPVIYVESDPNLIDLILGPNDGPNSVGDQQVHTGYEIRCEGERFGFLHKVDDRVLVMPWENSATNFILEKPLPKVRIKAYQAQLKSMKFYDGELSGELDDATLRASRSWYEYRARLSETQPVPVRPAMTENLFDGLNVLE